MKTFRQVNFIKYILLSSVLSVYLNTNNTVANTNKKQDSGTFINLENKYLKIQPTANMRAGWQYINGVSKNSRPILKGSIICPFMQNQSYFGLLSVNLLNGWSLSKDSCIKDSGLLKSWRLSIGGKKIINSNSFFGSAIGIDLTGNSPKNGFLYGLNLSGEYGFDKGKINIFGKFYGNEAGEAAAQKYKIAPNLGGAINAIIAGWETIISTGVRFGEKVALPVTLNKLTVKRPVWLRIDIMSIKLFKLMTINLDLEHSNLFNSKAEGNTEKSWLSWIQVGADAKFDFIKEDTDYKTDYERILGTDFKYCPNIGYDASSENADSKFEVKNAILDPNINNNTTVSYKSKVDENAKPEIVLSGKHCLNMDPKKIEIKDGKIDGEQEITLNKGKLVNYTDVKILPATKVSMYKDKGNNTLLGTENIYVGNYNGIEGESIKISPIEYSEDLPADYPNKGKLGIDSEPKYYSTIELSSDKKELLPNTNKLLSLAMNCNGWDIKNPIDEVIDYWVESLGKENQYMVVVGIKDSNLDSSDKEKISKYNYQLKMHPNSKETTINLTYKSKFELSKNILKEDVDKAILEYANQVDIQKDKKPVIILSNGYCLNMGTNEGATQIQEIEVKNEKIDGEQDITLNKEKLVNYTDVKILPATKVSIYTNKDKKNNDTLLGTENIYVGNYKDIEGESIKISPIEYSEDLPADYPNKGKLGIESEPKYYSTIELSSDKKELLPNTNKLLSLAMNCNGWDIKNPIDEVIDYWVESLGKENQYMVVVGIKDSNLDSSDKEKISNYEYQLKMHPNSKETTINLTYKSKFELSKNILKEDVDKAILEYANQVDIQKDKKPVIILSNGYCLNMGTNEGATQIQEIEVKNEKIDGKQIITTNKKNLANCSDVRITPAANIKVYTDKDRRTTETLIGDENIYVGGYDNIEAETVQIAPINCDDSKQLTLINKLTNMNKLGITTTLKYFSLIQLSSDIEEALPSKDRLLSFVLNCNEWELNNTIEETIDYWIESLETENKYALMIGIKDGVPESDIENISKYEYQLKLHPHSKVINTKLNLLLLNCLLINGDEIIPLTHAVNNQYKIIGHIPYKDQEMEVYLNRIPNISIALKLKDGDKNTYIDNSTYNYYSRIYLDDMGKFIDDIFIKFFVRLSTTEQLSRMGDVILFPTYNMQICFGNMLASKSIFLGDYTGITKDSIKIEFLTDKVDLTCSYLNKFIFSINREIIGWLPIQLVSEDTSLLPSKKRNMSIKLAAKSNDEENRYDNYSIFSHEIIYWIESLQQANCYCVFFTYSTVNYDENLVSDLLSANYELSIHPYSDPVCFKFYEQKMRVYAQEETLYKDRYLIMTTDNNYNIKFMIRGSVEQDAIYIILTNTFIVSYNFTHELQGNIKISNESALFEEFISLRNEDSSGKIDGVMYLDLDCSKKINDVHGIKLLSACYISVDRTQSATQLIDKKHVFMGDYNDIDRDTIEIVPLSPETEKYPTKFPNKEKLGVPIDAVAWAPFQLKSKDSNLLPSDTRMLSIAVEYITEDDITSGQEINCLSNCWFESLDNDNNKYGLFLSTVYGKPKKSKSVINRKRSEVFCAMQIKIHPEADPTYIEAVLT